MRQPDPDPDSFCTIILIAKEPLAGKVKTRLCPPCAGDQAALIARAALVDTVRAIEASRATRLVVALEGERGSWIPPGADVVPQSSGGLDLRLQAAFDEVAHELPDAPALVLGMDTPQVTATQIDDAIGLLVDHRADAVIGPALDGGYWTIGFSAQVLQRHSTVVTGGRARPATTQRGLFRGVPMSTVGTATAQIERLDDLGIAWVGVEPLRDLDTWEDAAVIAGDHPELAVSGEIARVALALEGTQAEADLVISHPLRAKRPDAATRAVRADYVVPMSDVGSDPIRDGVVVHRDGTILDVASAAEALSRHPDAEVTHLSGCALLPGLVNAHAHLAMSVFRGVADDRSLEDFLATVVPLEAEHLSRSMVLAGSLAAMVESHLAGVTTALDMYFWQDAVFEAARQCGFRVLAGPVVLDSTPPDLPATSAQQRLEIAESRLEDHAAALKASRGDEWLVSAVPPVLNAHSTYLVSPESLAAAARLAERHGAVLHMHLAESEAEVRAVLSAHGGHPFEIALTTGCVGPRTVFAHGVHLDAGQIEQIAANGSSIAHCPASNLKLGSGVAPVPELVAAGVNVAIGTDGSASSNDLDVLGATRLAALLHKTVGRSPVDPARLDARAALWMATRGGAAALGLGGSVGQLAPGFAADFIAVDLDTVHAQPVRDVHSAVVYAAGRGDVVDVCSGGRWVVRRRRHQLIDADEVVHMLKSQGAIVRPGG